MLAPAVAFALPSLQTRTATAAHRQHSFTARVEPSVTPAVFDGDVRNLPPVPSARGVNIELEGPAPNKVSPSAPAPMSVEAVTPSMPSPSVTFAGLHFSGSCIGGQCGAGWPPDTVGDVGPNNYIEAVNTAIGIYNKTGAQQAAFTFNSLWSGAGTGTGCDSSHGGDPTVVYDQMADRWFVADFAFVNFSAPPYYECVAVSKTGDPVSGGWYLYAIRGDDASHPWFPDYPKMGIWPDGLYMTANMFDCRNPMCPYKEVRVWAFNRSQMEVGSAVQVIVVDTNASFYSMLAGNLRGTPPPAGTPEYVVSEDQSLYDFDVFKFHVDWAAPASSTFTGPTLVSQTSYTVQGGAFIPQPNTTTKLDSLEDRLMMQAQYRNISGIESLWVSHTVGNAPAGVQWAQINVSSGTVSTAPAQQGIWTNVGGDGVARWMPSLAVDSVGDMAVGYSASSSTLFPSIRYAGRLTADPANTLGQGEAMLFAGTGSQINLCGGSPCTRWGDYTSMSVDPTDDCTFWYVGQYYTTNPNGGDWRTRIGSFKFAGCGATGPRADVSITKADAPDPVLADSTITYTLTVSNAGPSNATNVSVTDALPASVMVGSSTPSQGSCIGTATVSCSLGGINSGSNASVTITVTPVQPGTITNNASVAATESDPNAGNNSAGQATTVNSQPKTKYVSVTDSGFSASSLSAPQGTTVQWNFFGPSSTSVGDGTGMGLFSSGPKTPVSYFRFTYIAAGQYTVADGLGHSQLVKVALKVKPTTGTTSTIFTVTWSSAGAPAGFAFDVQVLRPGGSWSNWLTGQTGKSGSFIPDAGAGTYRFRARMRNTGAGTASAYSAARTVSVS